MFSEKLKSARKTAGITQEELAEASGIALASIRGLEQGQRPDPHFSTVQKLAKALGLTCHDLADEEITEEPEKKPKKKK